MGDGPPRGDASEIPVGKVTAPKGRWMTVSPRGDGTEVPVSRVAVAKTGRGPVRGRFERDSWIVRHVGMALEYL